MLRSTRENHGNYTFRTYVQRGLELCSPKLFFEYRDEYLSDWKTFRSILLMLDYYCCLVRYGTTICDFFEYQFWKKSAYERSKYISMFYSRKIQKVFNTGDKEVYLDKTVFNKKFAAFRTAAEFEFTQDTTVSEFQDFVHKANGKIIAKPFMGASGWGIFIPDVSTEEKAVEVYNKLKSDGNYFCEELFIQDGILHDLNPSSVNTVRIFTLYDGSNVHVMACCLRIGGGKACVDNIHSGGMICELDAKTGVVIGPGYNLKGERYFYHPVSNIFLMGIQIPQWSRVIKMVKEAAMVCPNLGHSAWDIAIGNTKIHFIEANEQGNFDAPQTASQRGYKPDYLPYMNNR